MAFSDVGLLFKIKADSDQARAEMTKLRKQFDTDVKDIEQSGKNAFLKLGESVGLSTNQMAGLAKAAPIAGAAIAGAMAIAAAAAVAAGAAIFALAKETADFGSKINDASLKTGLTAETLSGLDLQLKQSGTSMEALTRGIFLLQKNLEAMADGSKKGTEALQKIGLKPNQLGDTELVLRTVLKHLAAMPDEAARNAEGARLMGRSYQELAVFVADTGGNIDIAIEKAREMGLVMSQDAARDADFFGDKLDELSNRAAGMGRVIGMEVIPQILDAMNQLNEMIRSSPDLVSYSAGAIKGFINEFIIIPLQQANAIVTILRSNFETLGSGLNRQINEMNSILARQSAAAQGPDISGGAGESNVRAPRFGGGGGGGGGGGRARAVETDEDRALKLLKQKQEELSNLTNKTDLQRLAVKLLSDEYNGLSQATLRAIIQTQRDIEAKKAAALAAELTAKAEKMVTEFVKDQVRELNALHGIAPTAMDDVDALVASVEALGGPFVLPFNESLMRLRALAIDGAAAVLALKDAIELTGGSGGLPGGGTGEMAPVDAGTPPPGGLVDWGGLTTTIADSLGVSTGIIQQFGSMATATFQQVAQGVGEAVSAFVLLGTAGGGIKKFAAQMIASLAQMAATQAVFELAQGLAMLALNYFFPTPNLAQSAATHFAAAAIFGGIAAIAAVGGRALAGDSFKQQGAGGGGGGGGTSPTGRPGYEPPETRTVEQERAQQQRRLDIYLHTESNDSHILKVLKEDTAGNGYMRQTFALKHEV